MSLHFHASHLHDTIKGGGGGGGGGGVVLEEEGAGLDEGAAAPMRGSVTVVPKPGKWTLAASSPCSSAAARINSFFRRGSYPLLTGMIRAQA